MTGAINAMKATEVQQQAGTAILGKAIDSAKTQGVQLAQLLQPSKQAIQDPLLGNSVNLLA